MKHQKVSKYDDYECRKSADEALSKTFFITQDNCWFSLPSRCFKTKLKINKFTLISWKNDFLIKEKGSYTYPTLRKKMQFLNEKSFLKKL